MTSIQAALTIKAAVVALTSAQVEAVATASISTLTPAQFVKLAASQVACFMTTQVKSPEFHDYIQLIAKDHRQAIIADGIKAMMSQLNTTLATVQISKPSKDQIYLLSKAKLQVI